MDGGDSKILEIDQEKVSTNVTNIIAENGDRRIVRNASRIQELFVGYFDT